MSGASCCRCAGRYRCALWVVRGVGVGVAGGGHGWVVVVVGGWWVWQVAGGRQGELCCVPVASPLAAAVACDLTMSYRRLPTTFHVQYLEELEELEASKGVKAMPGKRPLLPAQEAAASIGELGRDALRTLVGWRRLCCAVLRLLLPPSLPARRQPCKSAWTCTPAWPLPMRSCSCCLRYRYHLCRRSSTPASTSCCARS